MSVISGKIVCWLIKKEVLLEDDKDVYEYAIYSCILTFLPLIIILFIGLLMNRLLESLLIILPFMFIRKFSGGYHAKHSWVCVISSCGILFLCVYLIGRIQYCIWNNIIMAIAIISLIIFSPIDSENRRLSDREKKIYKQTTVYIVMVFLALYVGLLFFEKIYALCIFEGIVLTASLQVPCIISKMFR